MALVEFSTEIPDGATEAEMRYYRAQMAIFAIFHTGDMQMKRGAATLTEDEVERSLELAIALLLTANKEISAKSHIRDNGVRIGKNIIGMVNMMRNAGDTTADAIRAGLRLERGEPS